MSYTKTPKGETVYLSDQTRPMKTGQSLTPEAVMFFKEPKTMTEIAESQFFCGDYWAANRFQNKFIGNGTLKINSNGTIQLIDWDDPTQLIK